MAGFLGAGKTSLLRHMLSAEHGQRLAVLVNDFGEIDVDAQLIVNVEGETVSLANGCVCCTVREDLLREVLRLLSSGERFDRIVIETSGVSDPTVVAQTFLLPDLQGLVDVDGILSLVDASEFLGLAGDHGELAARQVRVADLLLVNKTDLAAPEQVVRLRAHLRREAPRARVLETTHGRAPLELVLGVGGSRVGEAEGLAAIPDHSRTFRTWTYSTRRPVSFLALRKALEELPVDIYRAKGWVWVEQAPDDRAEFQMTGRRAWLRLGRGWENVEPETQLVFIGGPDATDTDRLAQLFDRCIQDFGGRAPADASRPVALTDLRSLSIVFE